MQSKETVDGPRGHAALPGRTAVPTNGTEPLGQRACSLVLAFTWNWNKWVGAASKQTTDDAYLQADITPLAAKVGGYVAVVAVHDFQIVNASGLLVQIEDDDYRAQVAQAEANIQAATAAIENIEKQKEIHKTLIQQAEATVTATQSDVWRYGRDSARYQSLAAHDVASIQTLDQATNAHQRAQATLDLNNAQLDQQREQLEQLDVQKLQAEATLKSQEAALDLARLNLKYTKIVAPVAGMVGQRKVKPGQYVSVGTRVISVVPLPNVWVIANYKETQLRWIARGQPATVTVDVFPDVVFKGHVDTWSPATGSQFSLLPPDNATGNFTNVVARIPVKIVLDPKEPFTKLLRPGMSVVATIDTREGGRAGTP